VDDNHLKASKRYITSNLLIGKCVALIDPEILLVLFLSWMPGEYKQRKRVTAENTGRLLECLVMPWRTAWQGPIALFIPGYANARGLKN